MTLDTSVGFLSVPENIIDSVRSWGDNMADMIFKIFEPLLMFVFQ